MKQSHFNLEGALSKLMTVAWFSRVGQPEIKIDTLTIHAYLSVLGRTDCKIRYVYNSDDVKACTKVNFDPEWFFVEENRCHQLLQSIDVAETDELHQAMKSVIDPMSDQVMQAAENYLNFEDLQFQKVAAGSAIEVCYQYLVEFALSKQTSKIFARKLDIFRQGRWPLTGSDKIFAVY